MPELLRRRLIPSMIIRLAAIDWPSRFGAKVRRTAGREGRVELFFAFDDPCSAYAVVELADRVAGRQVDLVLLPVVRRGIADDPAVEDKRHYAIEDARRLARRAGLELMRDDPLDPHDVSPLAAAAAAITDHAERATFCTAALRALWFGGVAPAVPEVRDAAEVIHNEGLMARRGAYDTPMAYAHGQLYFAHDRLPQLVHRLDRLGWAAA